MLDPSSAPAILLALIFLAAWLPRIAGLDHSSHRETRWLAGSANFLQAISHADFADTYQKEHPGVPCCGWARWASGTPSPPTQPKRPVNSA